MTAVEVISGYKFYGREKDPNKNVILNQLNMNVPRGCIYGLLGASGCGKTTLLSCLVGQRKLNGGTINVLGTSPGEPGCGIPGNRVGYMPQDIALTSEMTIKEIIFYFGRIYDMPDQRIEERYRQLKELMEFPMDDDRLVGQCSGGQQRRISFACAMVHEPELLILDEPTVGLDPLLREKIWDFLVDTTRNSKLAVIITTHYIEEARQANMIGMMRSGVLLAENSPQSILQSYNTPNLEEAFLQMCQAQGELATEHTQPQSVISVQSLNRSTMDEPVSITPSTPAEDKLREAEGEKKPEDHLAEENKFKKKYPLTTARRMKALLYKNTMQLLRNQMSMGIMIIFPILQLSCFYLAVGGHPKDLKIGIVNSEVQDFRQCQNESHVTTFVHDYECDLHQISCRFINGINSTIGHKIYYDTEDEAYAAARSGHIIGYIYFAKNFSASTEEIIALGRKAANESVDDREIQIHLDMTNQQLVFYVQRKLLELYSEFTTDLMTDCEYRRKLGNTPVFFENPVYGSINEEFKEFVAPGVILTMLFFLASIATSTVFISDRHEGIWERTLIAGASLTELLIAHIIVHTVVLIIQCLMVMVFVGLFLAPEGDVALIIFLFVLVAFAGLQFGLLISIFCSSHTMANFVATGFFYPMIIFCGLLWPLEGMPEILQVIAKLFPFTVPTVSMRNIIQRGWHITNVGVYQGFLVIIGWIAVFSICSLLGLRRSK